MCCRRTARESRRPDRAPCSVPRLDLTRPDRTPSPRTRRAPAMCTEPSGALPGGRARAATSSAPLTVDGRPDAAGAAQPRALEEVRGACTRPAAEICRPSGPVRDPPGPGVGGLCRHVEPRHAAGRRHRRAFVQTRTSGHPPAGCRRPRRPTVAGYYGARHTRQPRAAGRRLEQPLTVRSHEARVPHRLLVRRAAAGVTDAIALCEKLGFDSIWTAEAYGSDCLTPLAWWGASTSTGSARHRRPADVRAHPGRDRDGRD